MKKTFRTPDRKIEEWDELTESNAHGIRIARIADYLSCVASNQESRNDLYEIAQVANTINSLHDRRRCLSGRLYEIRETLRKTLRDTIRYEFGEEELKRINP